MFARAASGVVVETWSLAQQKKLATVSFPLAGEFERGITVDLDGTRRAGVVLRSTSGQLLAIGADGKQRWQRGGAGRPREPGHGQRRGRSVHALRAQGRGQRIRLCRQPALAASVRRWAAPGAQPRANQRGERGRSRRRKRRGDGVVGRRRLRAVVDRTGPAADRAAAGRGSDGDPRSLELVVGGKKGGLWGFQPAGGQLFRSPPAPGKSVKSRLFLARVGGRRSRCVVGGSEGGLLLLTARGTRAGRALLRRQSSAC